MFVVMMLLSAMVSSIPMRAMDFFKTEKDRTFSIIAQNGSSVPIRYENAVQIQVLHPLKSSQQFISQHTVRSIKSFLRALHHTRKGTLGTYLKCMPDAELPVSIDEQLSRVKKSPNITNEEKIRLVVQDLYKKDETENEKSIRAVLSVAHELKATDFAMICMSHLINLDGQRQLFSLMVPPNKLSRFQEVLDKYIVESTAIERRKKNVDEQDAFLSQRVQSASIRPDNKKMMRTINQKIEISNMTTQELSLLLKQGQRSSPRCGLYSGDGKKFACIYGQTLYVLNAADRKLLNQYKIGHFSRGMYLTLSKDGDRAVVVGQYSNFLDADTSCIMVFDIKEPGVVKMLYSCENIMYMNSLYMRDDNKIVFYDNQREIMYGNSWNLNKGRETISQLNFAQQALLYQLDELATSKESSLPVMTGFVREYVHISLPDILREWAKDKLHSIHKSIQ